MENNNINLSPPWYTLQNEFLYTFGNNPLITIKPLNIPTIPSANKTYTLEIIAKDDDLSFALRQIIKLNFNFGTINVRTLIKNSVGTIEKMIDTSYEILDVADLFCTAFKNNSLFKRIVIKSNIIFLIFNKSIIQFFNDDITDLCQNYNEIASRVFWKLSINKFKSISNPNKYFIVYFNTYSDKCIGKNKLYCPKSNLY